MKNERYYDAKHEVMARRKLSKRINGNAASEGATHLRPRVSILAIEQGAKGKRRMAVVAVSGAGSDFWGPEYALLKALQDEANAIEPSEVLVVPAAQCDYEPPTSQGKRANRFTWKMAIRRMKKIAGYFRKCWRDMRDRHGMFFMYDDKVLYQTWSQAGGWKNMRVPEDGLAR